MLGESPVGCSEGRHPSLSVVVPAYQAEGSIGRLLGSILAWRGDGMEVIVVDDGSTDGTALVVSAVASHDSRVRLVSQPNGGRSAARNVGLSHARGEWVMFADADDYLLDSWQDKVRAALASGGDLSIFSMVRSYGVDVHGDKAGASRDLPAVELGAAVVYRALVDGSCGATVPSAGSFEWNSCWARLYRRSVVERVVAANGGNAFPVGLRFSEDRLFNLAYLKAMGDSGVVFDYTPVYCWDLGLSSTVARVSAGDPGSLIAFAGAAEAMGAASGFAEDVPKVIATEAASQFRRSASLPTSSLGVAAGSWRRVIEAGVLDKCAGLLGEFIDGRAWAYRPALSLLSAGRPLGALALAHGATAAGSLLKLFRRGR